MHINTKQGLDIPISGKPNGKVVPFETNAQPIQQRVLALDFSPFVNVKPKLLKKVGEIVKGGEPLVCDKRFEDRVFVSPAGGIVREIVRGKKRRLIAIVIDVAENEEWISFSPLEGGTREQILQRLLEGGLFPLIRQRPFDRLANPELVPRDIFVKAIESAPFAPPAELQIEGHEADFQAGLDALTKLTDGAVHIVSRPGSKFSEMQNVKCHTAEGPHPIGNSSVHIHHITPIETPEEVVWTLTADDVVQIGHFLSTGKYLIKKIVAIGGPAVLEGRAVFTKVRRGAAVKDLLAGRVQAEHVRLISGDVLTGNTVTPEGFLGFYDNAFVILKERKQREFLHFFRLGVNKFTNSRSYFSGWFGRSKKFEFDTNKHGEDRYFIIGEPYERVMPMNIPTMQLVKSVMAEDYDLAEEYGLLEVAPEDFALASFVCPSKLEMVEIMTDGLRAYAAEVLD